MHRLYLIVILLLYLTSSNCQIFYDFEDGSLSDWSGQVSDFIINEDARLQLQAAEGGNSFVSVEHELADSMLWTIDLEMDFSPSTSNNLEIWLTMDVPDPTLASGFLFRIGETGADDAIKLIERLSGSDQIIMEGTMGAVSSAFRKSISIIKDGNDKWTLTTKTPGDVIPEEVHEAVYSTDLFEGPSTFGIFCTYTDTRTDKFFFDDILISELQPDTESPQLISYEIVEPRKLILQFDEALGEASALDINNYNVTGNSVISADFSNGNENVLCLGFENDWETSQVYLLTVNNVTDKSNNILTLADLALLLYESPEPNDILINEILYDPITGRTADFVELINSSNKFLALDSLLIRRADGTGSEVFIQNNLKLDPQEIIAITTNREEIVTQFDPPDSANIVEQTLPNFVNEEGIVTLIKTIDNQRIMIDSFYYTDDYHNSFLTGNQTDGITLERLSTVSATNDPNNWSSAGSASNFGTPGYENSQRLGTTQGDEIITLENKVFSPNGDGYKDEVLVRYKLDKTGYAGNLRIFSDTGVSRRVLMNNELLSSEGQLRWDGIMDDGTLAPIGMYILYFDFFHPDGNRYSGKQVCVLAQQLN